ncbi:hypothetical protein CISIN_1g038090mg, partial [Citrus sinensis]
HSQRKINEQDFGVETSNISRVARALQLGVLDLSYNHFAFKLQKSGLSNLAKKLTNLIEIYLIDVDTSSAVSPTLTNLSSLIYLSISECSSQDLFGYLPKSQKGSLLEDLRLSFTKFLGKIPPSLGNLTNLEDRYLSDNGFSGELPTSLGKLNSLKTFDISSCNILGKIPTSLLIRLPPSVALSSTP